MSRKWVDFEENVEYKVTSGIETVYKNHTTEVSIAVYSGQTFLKLGRFDDWTICLSRGKVTFRRTIDGKANGNGNQEGKSLLAGEGGGG